jgi:hypothetical protein
MSAIIKKDQSENKYAFETACHHAKVYVACVSLICIYLGLWNLIIDRVDAY